MFWANNLILKILSRRFIFFSHLFLFSQFFFLVSSLPFFISSVSVMFFSQVSSVISSLFSQVFSPNKRTRSQLAKWVRNPKIRLRYIVSVLGTQKFNFYLSNEPSNVLKINTNTIEKYTTRKRR